MKKMFLWGFLTVVFVIAVLAILVIGYTYKHPSVDPTELQRLTDSAGHIVDVAFVSSAAIGVLCSLIPGFRKRYHLWNESGLRREQAWHVKLCQVLMAVSFLLMIFSISYLGIKVDKGQWMVGGGKGDPWHSVSEPQAVVYLWKDLRAYAAFLLFMSLGWWLFLISLVSNRQRESASRYGGTL